MPVLEKARRAVGAAPRVVTRNTSGLLVRQAAAKTLADKQAHAERLERVAELVGLRAKIRETLQPEDFRQASKAWNIAPDTLHALANAESDGAGFDAEGRLIILAEPHVFSALSARAFDVKYPHLSYPTWTPRSKGAAPPGKFDRHPYTYSQDERWGLVAQWLELAGVEAGIGAMSAGRFQQLIGSPRANVGWRPLGFESGEHLFRRLAESEFAQLEVLHRFILVHGLDRALRERDWRKVALGYNGSGQVDRYAARLATEHKRVRTHYA